MTTPKMTTDPVGVSYSTTQQTPDGLWNVTTTTLIKPVPPPVVIPPPGPVLVIPAGAKTSGILDNFSPWKAEKDAGTPGKVTSTFNKFIDTNSGRQFNAVQTGKAGMRWSTNFAKNSAPTNFVYELYLMLTDPTQIGQIELDMNQMMADGRNCYLCLQANSNDGTWDYTTTPGTTPACHWNKSNILTNPKNWAPNVWHHIRLKTSHDANGIVTYEGVEFDDVYQLFDSTCKGLSAIKENWTPGSLINNFQLNGANATGILNAFVKQMQVWYWPAA